MRHMCSCIRSLPLCAAALLASACAEDPEATTTAAFTSPTGATSPTSTTDSGESSSSTTPNTASTAATASTANTTGTSTGSTGASETGTDPSSTSGSSTSGSSTSGGEQDLCQPVGDLLVDGSLDLIEGDAPKAWEVRTPGQVDACAGSGPHLFAADPAPGCGGAALTIDANDAWDCYAVQTVSPYNSIEGGQTYVIRATLRSQGNAVNPAAWFVLGVQWLDENDTFFGDEKNPMPGDPADNDYNWRVLEWEVTAPANARRILVWMTAHYPGEVTYDHIAVLKKD